MVRWKRELLAVDSKRGTLERWHKKQKKHLGEYDPVTGEKINDGIPSRRFDE
ncbi:hypothetical protein YSY43_15330 [Paenibacillus sp. YSY-4.3]